MKKEEWRQDLKIGDKVVVKDGTLCPDLKDLDIGGWKGEIKEISEDDKKDVLVCVEWDDDTIKSMPKNFIDQGEEEGLDNNVMYLYPEDVKLITID